MKSLNDDRYSSPNTVLADAFYNANFTWDNSGVSGEHREDEAENYTTLLYT